MSRVGIILGLGLVIATGSLSHANSRFRNKSVSAPDPVNGHVVYKKKNVVDFDDSLIEGDLKNPGEFYFVHRQPEKFGTLVKKRPNFHKEMLRDTVMIR